MHANHESLLVTVETAAKMLGIGRTRLYELLRRGEIRAVQIGRSRRVPVSELERFVDCLLLDEGTKRHTFPSAGTESQPRA